MLINAITDVKILKSRIRIFGMSIIRRCATIAEISYLFFSSLVLAIFFTTPLYFLSYFIMYHEFKTNDTTFYNLSYYQTNCSTRFTQTIRHLTKQHRLEYLVINTDIRISIFYSITIRN